MCMIVPFETEHYKQNVLICIRPNKHEKICHDENQGGRGGTKDSKTIKWTGKVQKQQKLQKRHLRKKNEIT